MSILPYPLTPVFAHQVIQMDHLGDTEEAPEADPVVFLSAEPEKEVSDVAAQIAKAENGGANSTVKVRVFTPYRVVHEGKPYVGGDEVTVPGDVAELWEKSQWVERVKTRASRATAKEEN